MKAPSTPKPDRLHPTPGLTPPTANQYADISYITLAGLFNTMVPAARPWALVGQPASYLIKLAPLLWWALPSPNRASWQPRPTDLPWDALILTKEHSLLCNGGVNAKERTRYSATPQGLNSPPKCKAWLAGGAFSTGPELFSQDCNIHVHLESSTIYPIIHPLLKIIRHIYLHSDNPKGLSGRDHPHVGETAQREQMLIYEKLPTEEEEGTTIG
ncbi:hypothetical protein DSO57_1038484 [Entomophthora muscae]|uniref:Uncharacterized protein n=1 Tax=Entomophthora muscae TaxID=34485 RepID=A0ACC2S0T4_9FUNG|nr:hypothetical protein DSO57_1038484 [Entomophthora muscae]